MPASRLLKIEQSIMVPAERLTNTIPSCSQSDISQLVKNGSDSDSLTRIQHPTKIYIFKNVPGPVPLSRVLRFYLMKEQWICNCWISENNFQFWWGQDHWLAGQQQHHQQRRLAGVWKINWIMKCLFELKKFITSWIHGDSECFCKKEFRWFS